MFRVSKLVVVEVLVGFVGRVKVLVDLFGRVAFCFFCCFDIIVVYFFLGIIVFVLIVVEDFVFW